MSTDEARALAATKPASFLHISRPEIDLPPGTSPYSDDAYARGAANLARLRRHDVLVRDDEPAYYVYRIEHAGPRADRRRVRRVRRGLRVAPDSPSRAHATRQGERPRAQHRSLNAQTGPVLLAYRANVELRTLVHTAASGAPLMSTTGPNETRHTIWHVAEPELVTEIGAAFEQLDALYIADGHHRSAAALRVAEARRAAAGGRHQSASSAVSPRARGGSRNPSEPSYESFLAVAFPHDEMQILAYNRVVRDLNGLTVEALLARLRESFEVQPSRGGRWRPRGARRSACSWRAAGIGSRSARRSCRAPTRSRAST